jgi:hypothetical protein
MHVLITKPPVKTLAEHTALAALSAARNLLCCAEVHKRSAAARPAPAPCASPSGSLSGGGALWAQLGPYVR